VPATDVVRKLGDDDDTFAGPAPYMLFTHIGLPGTMPGVPTLFAE